MPPFEPVKSKAQSRALFAKAARGELSMADAKGKTKAANFQKLPERIGSQKKKSSRVKRATPRRSNVRGS